MYSRRELGKYLLAGIPTVALAKLNSKINGVMIGAQSYSFRDLPLDKAIEGYKQIGLSYAELTSGHVEPKLKGTGKELRENLRKWRTTVPLDHFYAIREQFKQAGIELYAFNYSFRDDFTGDEIGKGFEFAKALGVKYITSSSNVATAKRVDPYARESKIMVGLHNHSKITPNEFARPEDFTEAMTGLSNYIGINLDIGHFYGAGFDPVKFLEEHHQHIVTLHIKDKNKQDQNMPFGKGTTPIREVLQVLKTKKYKIPAMIEYEYKGESDSVTEVRKCFEYCKLQLA